MRINSARVTSRTINSVTQVVADHGPRLKKLPLFPLIWSWKAHILELALIVGCYLVYMFTRGVVFSNLDEQGLANASHIVSAEKWAGIFWEPLWQSWVLEHIDGLALFFNWVYIITYWPIIVVVGLALYFLNRPQYYYFRSVVLVNLILALLIFMLFPVTSPFNVADYFVNTIQTLGPSVYGSADMVSYYNTNAAMPSLHFSWTVILGVVFVRILKGWFKPLGLLYPATTFFAITITGNHFILDAIAGGLLAGLAFAVIELGFRRQLFRRHLRCVTQTGLLRGQGAQFLKNWARDGARMEALVGRPVVSRR